MTLRYRDVGPWGLAAYLILGRVSFALVPGILSANMESGDRVLVLCAGAVALAGLLLGFFQSITWTIASLAILACLAVGNWLASRPEPSGELIVAFACVGTMILLLMAPKRRGQPAT